MRKIRIGKDIYFTWQILTNKEPVPLEGRDLKLMLKNPLGRFLDFHFEIYQGNKLKFTFHGTDHKHLGTYLWGIERSGFFNDRGKWVKGFENQMV